MLDEPNPYAVRDVCWLTLYWVATTCEATSLGPLLESPSSNLNLLRSTICSRDSINESGDSGIHPFIQAWFCIISSLFSFRLSRLNITAIVSLLVPKSEASNWG